MGQEQGIGQPLRAPVQRHAGLRCGCSKASALSGAPEGWVRVGWAMGKGCPMAARAAQGDANLLFLLIFSFKVT